MPLTDHQQVFHQTVRFNPHVAQMNAPPLPIAVRPISNSPQNMHSSRT